MKRVKQVTLLVTRRCNLRCSYCYVRDYRGGDMELETAQRIVSRVFREELEGYDCVEFTFLGGEPFLAFPLLRSLSEWMWARRWPVEYLLSTVTNGTVLSAEMREWLCENRHRFFVSLSYDGSKASQDRNRDYSGGKIDLAFFHENWPHIPVKMTITEDSAGSMAGDIISLREQGIAVNDTFAGGVPPWSEASLKILDEQLERLCTYELSHENVQEDSLLAIDLLPVLFEEAKKPFFCGAGSARVTYDFDGRRYPCHLLSPLVLHEEEVALAEQAQEAPQECVSCETCPLDAICPACEGNSFRLYRCFHRREASVCGLFRHQVRYACRYQAKRILSKSEISRREQLTLAAIHRILSGLLMFAWEENSPTKNEQEEKAL